MYKLCNKLIVIFACEIKVDGFYMFELHIWLDFGSTHKVVLIRL